MTVTTGARIPIATTTLTVTRLVYATDVDPYDDPQPAPTTTATGVRAVIGTPSANVALSGGQRVEYSAKLTCDPCDIQPGDQVTDAQGGQWEVLWAKPNPGLFGWSFINGDLRLVQGAI